MTPPEPVIPAQVGVVSPLDPVALDGCMSYYDLLVPPEDLTAQDPRREWWGLATLLIPRDGSFVWRLAFRQERRTWFLSPRGFLALCTSGTIDTWDPTQIPIAAMVQAVVPSYLSDPALTPKLRVSKAVADYQGIMRASVAFLNQEQIPATDPTRTTWALWQAELGALEEYWRTL